MPAAVVGQRVEFGGQGAQRRVSRVDPIGLERYADANGHKRVVVPRELRDIVKHGRLDRTDAAPDLGNPNRSVEARMHGDLIPESGILGGEDCVDLCRELSLNSGEYALAATLGHLSDDEEPAHRVGPIEGRHNADIARKQLSGGFLLKAPATLRRSRCNGLLQPRWRGGWGRSSLSLHLT